MSLLKELLNETRKIQENDLFAPDTVETPVEAPAVEEIPAEVEAPAEEALQITDELVAELAQANPEISEVDPTEFKKGLENEIEHLESVGGDLNVVAKIVLDHLNKYPGKDYYGALCTMETQLAEPAVEEEVPTEETPVAEEPVTDVPAVEEPPVEEAKDPTSKSQPTGKALDQTKNESTATEVAKEEKDAKKEEAAEKKEEVKNKEENKANEKK